LFCALNNRLHWAKKVPVNQKQPVPSFGADDDDALRDLNDDDALWDINDDDALEDIKTVVNVKKKEIKKSVAPGSAVSVKAERKKRTSRRV
jgi:hypothetical protein